MKVKELVTKAEHSYNRIEGYSKNDDGNSEYWATQLPSYQKIIDLHKAQVQETIEKLAEKGIDVTQIEFQTKTTEEKITELNKNLEELPETRENLIIQYKIEKEEQLKINGYRDYVRDRANENLSLFKVVKIKDTKQNVEIGQLVKQKIIQKDNINQEQTVSLVRKR